MATPTKTTGSPALMIVCMTLLFAINIVRMIVALSPKPAPTPALTADEVYRLTGQPVTNEQQEAEFDRKYAHGSLERMREIQNAMVPTQIDAAAFRQGDEQ